MREQDSLVGDLEEPSNELKDPSNSMREIAGAAKAVKPSAVKVLEKELNGPKGLEPTRYGDWESKGRCYDF
jgi:hypothetical protein